MGLPQVGHLDPYFLELMEDIKALLRYTFQTKNDFTIPVSGTGSAAMEACVCNMIEPGDTMLIGVNGYFGNRYWLFQHHWLPCELSSALGGGTYLYVDDSSRNGKPGYLAGSATWRHATAPRWHAVPCLATAVPAVGTAAGQPWIQSL